MGIKFGTTSSDLYEDEHNDFHPLLAVGSYKCYKVTRLGRVSQIHVRRVIWMLHIMREATEQLVVGDALPIFIKTNGKACHRT